MFTAVAVSLGFAFDKAQMFASTGNVYFVLHKTAN